MRRPDGKFICHCVELSVPAAKLEQILGLFETLHATVSSGEVAPLWSTWSFEQGHIRFAARPDGWLLGLLVRPDSEAFERLDQLSEEFLSLQLDG